MQPSASFCRTQQAFHDARASSALLENVRMVANAAALAWAQEADIADQREARRKLLRQTVEGRAVADQFEDEDSLIFSENPDRGRPAD